MSGRIFIDLLRFNRQFAIGLVLVLIVAVFAVLSFLSPYPPNDSFVVPPDLPPSWDYLMGTTSRGQDLFWLLTFSIRNTLLFGITARDPLTFGVGAVLLLIVGILASYIPALRATRVQPVTALHAE